MSIVSRTVWVLSLVSLFTDIASEMLYPVMPIYLQSIQFSVVFIGILEGLAEAVAGLSKGYFGKLSDDKQTRLPFVRSGYFLSALSKPLMAAFTIPIWVFAVRTLDRLGKGIRTGARDAMLSSESTPQTKARVFGFHRSMDTLGAVCGPAVALLFLYLYPGSYKLMFVIAFFPGVAAIGLTFLLKENKPSLAADKRTGLLDFIKYVRQSPRHYQRLLAGLLMFALINSSDVFLLLKIKQATGSDTATIGCYIFYNLVYAALSYPLGALADKIGLKQIFTAGIFVFACVYGLMATAKNIYVFAAALTLYGVYAAATEGISKAWISNVVNKNDTATAIGSYTAFQSICALLASSLVGLIWAKFGGSSALLVSAVGAVITAVYMLFFTTNPNMHHPLPNS